MTTETTGQDEKASYPVTGISPAAEADRARHAKQISDRLLEIAPYPECDEDVTALGLAKYLAVRAAVINHQQLSPGVPFSRQQVDLLTVLFAASHALYAFALRSETEANQVALEMWNAREGGDGIGEWLWDHLGTATASQIGPLADELGQCQKAPEGLLAHADAIRTALAHAARQSKSANHQRAYANALRALDAEEAK